ncbi:F-box/LRR-repeat protein 20 [Hondaea fermentalgiana]|uniref:F-box/LRR-repeat protein 20 n=1 Tax=Hondaea fermentalgiana TaxID=2315210 RepID=A0A2R5GJI1_9STRA|nr:F-box/LRR-repeat protein 20 [Hondaea fermentalgiana]|eukprot:GBG31040.1 F-box/LRR-repeat protein 20 [Hondaea fermentalgiana]
MRRETSRASAKNLLALRLVCEEGWFRFAHREVLACSLVCRTWRAALHGFPAEDSTWHDVDWVERCFPRGDSFWRLTALRLKVSAPAPPVAPAKVHRFERELQSPLATVASQLRHLTSLALTAEFCRESSLTALKVCRSLQNLQLGNAARHGTLAFLENCTQLRSLQVFEANSLWNIDTLGKCCPKLTNLVLRQSVHMRDLEGIRGCRQLETIDLTGAIQLQNVEALAMCAQLSKCILVRCVALRNIEPFVLCENLEIVYLSHCSLVPSIEALRGKQRLHSLWLAHCGGLRDLTALASCPSLHTVSICNCPELFRQDILDPVLGNSSVRELYASGMDRSQLDEATMRRVTTDFSFYCDVLSRFGRARTSSLRAMNL